MPTPKFGFHAKVDLTDSGPAADTVSKFDDDDGNLMTVMASSPN
jgi:hypothetical protein